MEWGHELDGTSSMLHPINELCFKIKLQSNQYIRYLNVATRVINHLSNFNVYNMVISFSDFLGRSLI